MKTCATCRYWRADGDTHEAWDDEKGDTVTMPHRKCVLVIHGNGRERCTEATPAFVTDGSGYAASLWTLPTFGCTQHEPGVAP